MVNLKKQGIVKNGNSYTLDGKPLQIINDSIKIKKIKALVRDKYTRAIIGFEVKNIYLFCGIYYSLPVLKSIGIFFDKNSGNWFLLIKDNKDLKNEFSHGGGSNNNFILRKPDDLLILPRGGKFREFLID